jgi:hypothetical protein
MAIKDGAKVSNGHQPSVRKSANNIRNSWRIDQFKYRVHGNSDSVPGVRNGLILVPAERVNENETLPANI